MRSTQPLKSADLIEDKKQAPTSSSSVSTGFISSSDLNLYEYGVPKPDPFLKPLRAIEADIKAIKSPPKPGESLWWPHLSKVVRRENIPTIDTYDEKGELKALNLSGIFKLEEKNFVISADTLEVFINIISHYSNSLKKIDLSENNLGKRIDRFLDKFITNYYRVESLNIFDVEPFSLPIFRLSIFLWGIKESSNNLKELKWNIARDRDTVLEQNELINKIEEEVDYSCQRDIAIMACPLLEKIIPLALIYSIFLPYLVGDFNEQRQNRKPINLSNEKLNFWRVDKPWQGDHLQSESSASDSLTLTNG